MCNQEEADRDIPKLLDVPVTKRFLSIEPLLGAIDLTGNRPNQRALRWVRPMLPMLDWVIVGGESGPYARPMHPEWARSLRDQCNAADVPFLFKQWGEWTPGENVVRQRGVVPIASFWNDQWRFSTDNLTADDGHIDDEPVLNRVGKIAAGRMLDGRTWDEVPV